MARTDTLGHFLTDVADSIRTAEGSSGTIDADEFDTRIAALSGGVDLNDYYEMEIPEPIGAQNLGGIFLSFKKLPSFTFNGSRTSTALMFMGWWGDILPSFENFDVSNVTAANSMFYDCKFVKEFDLSTLTFSSLTNTFRMFYQCFAAEKIDIRGITLTNLNNYGGMFGSVPYDCEIIVADATQKAWMNTNFSSYTNVKTVAEYEAE